MTFIPNKFFIEKKIIEHAKSSTYDTKSSKAKCFSKIILWITRLGVTSIHITIKNKLLALKDKFIFNLKKKDKLSFE